MRILLLLTALALVSGCTRGQVDTPPADGSKDNVKNTDGLNAKDDFEDQLAALKPVDPVPAAKLAALLPKGPDGYTEEEPRTQDIEIDTFKYSLAERTYRKGDKTLEVKIQDAAHVRQLYESVVAGAKIKLKTNEMHHQPVNVDANPGFEQYTMANQRGELMVIVAKRHIVHIVAEGAPADFVLTVYKSIDRKALATLK